MAYLSILDWAVCIATLILSALIGVYFTWKSKNTDASEYLRGRKSLSVIPVALSLIASFTSGISLLGVPAEVYMNGTQYIICVVGLMLNGVAIAYIMIPVFIELKLDSCYEYLEYRFDRRVRCAASLLYVINQILFIPIVIYAPALALSQVTGVNVLFSSVGTSLVCIFYTVFGGIRAVVWTDALQTALMTIAFVTVALLGASEVGGIQKVFSINAEAGQIELFNLDPNPLKRHTMWTVILGIFPYYLAHSGTTQGFVQRYLAVPNLQAARRTVLYMTVGKIILMLTSGFTGLVLYAYFHECDPVATGRVSKSDQLIPLLVLEVAAHIPGLSGLFVAGVFSAALSTMSTGINAVCGVIVEDLLANNLSKKFSKVTWLRITAAMTGIVSVVLVFVVEKLGGLLQAAISVGSITIGTMLGLFLLGLFCPRATSCAALIGSAVSLTLTSLLVGGAQVIKYQNSKPTPIFDPENPCNVTLISTMQTPIEEDEVFPIFRLSYLYYTLVGTLLVLIVSMGISLLVPSRTATLPAANLLHPYARRFLPSEKANKKHEQNTDLASAQPLVEIRNKVIQ